MSVRSDWWRDVAQDALNGFLSTGPDSAVGGAFAYGMSAGASAFLNGWNHPISADLLSQLRALRNPDGGYGVGVPRDVYNDGTINPATTSYTVTMAGHVGPTLLSAYQAGAVPRAEVQTLVSLLVGLPRVAVSRGQCVAYSRSTNDTGHAVHNVNSGCGWFLQECAAAGFGATGMHGLITDIAVHQVQSYHDTTYNWSYSDTGGAQDADHNSYSAEAMYRLVYWTGREVAYNMVTSTLTDNAQAPVAYVRLAGLPGGIASQGLVDPTTTLWAEKTDQWGPGGTRVANYAASLSGGDRSAQLAYYAARAAVMMG